MGSGENEGSRKKWIIRIVILVVILCLVIVRFVVFSDTYHYDKVATSVQEINGLIDLAISKGKGEIYFESAISPNFLDFDSIMKRTTADGSYAGCELYVLRYEYKNSPNGYEVYVSLSDPSLYANFMAERRVKKIASKFKNLDEYEKIKGVHDYLVLMNRYVAFEGGAYSALCKGRSSCTGYAFSFYAIMRELGIPVTIETGGNHAWNRVQYNGKWYNMDVTWDDNGVDEVSYNYFMKCDRDWSGHHHGGSDAETSIAPTGKTAKEYYSMVPNYNLIDDIILILVFAIPVGILGFILYKKKKKEAPIEAGRVMTVGSWSFLMPEETLTGFEVIRKMCASPSKKDIWSVEDGAYIHKIDNETEKVHERIEVTEAVFFDELNFVISVSRNSNGRILGEALQKAKEVLETGSYKPGDYMKYGTQESQS